MQTLNVWYLHQKSFGILYANLCIKCSGDQGALRKQHTIQMHICIYSNIKVQTCYLEGREIRTAGRLGTLPVLALGKHLVSVSVAERQFTVTVVRKRKRTGRW